MLVSVVTLNLAKKSRPPPTIIQKCLSSPICCLLGASHLKRNVCCILNFISYHLKYVNTFNQIEMRYLMQEKSKSAIKEKKFTDEKESLNNELCDEDAISTQTSGHFWIALSVVLHRFMFFIYFIIFAVMINFYIFN